jgi:hypothetical protein
MPATPTPLTLNATEGVLRLLDGPPAPERLNAALRHLAKWRAQVLEATLVARSGDSVLAGPFKGMHYPVRSVEGSRSTRLLGVYEAGLSPVIETIIERAYDVVMNVGCAEGYYAVGLALRMPHVRIVACDTDVRAQSLCRALAAANGVGARIEVRGEVTPADFATLAGLRAVILCDIEGAEDGLLDPQAAPALRDVDLLVEVHEGVHRGLAERIGARFAASHRITRIGRSFSSTALPHWAEELSDLDRLLLLWEWRAAPTPWLWMEKL